MRRNLAQISELAQGVLNDDSYKKLIVNGVSKDTRTIKEGMLYIPIIGENFDGHDFLSQAKENGAVASLWQKNHDLPNIDMPLILVEDSLEAFQTMARNYREDLGIPVIAITGSNGKTTTKDILLSVLYTKYKTHATKGNENNEIGLPLTILNAPEDTEIMIVELGTESFGEIELLSRIACPHVAVITNIGDSHLDKLKTKENVAKEKLDIIKGLKESGVFVYNKDDDYLRHEVLSKRINNKTLSYGQIKDSKYIISDIDIKPNRTRFTVNGAVYQIASPGIHEAYNATISIIISQLFDIGPKELDQGLNNVKFNSMRNELVNLNGFDLIDDSYKANPQNVLAAIKTMNYYDNYNRKIVVLGDMLDLGDKINQLHLNTLKAINPKEIDYLLVYGDHMKTAYESGQLEYDDDKFLHFENKECLNEKLKEILVKNSLVLVKGSRVMHMEDVVNELKKIEI